MPLATPRRTKICSARCFLARASKKLALHFQDRFHKCDAFRIKKTLSLAQGSVMVILPTVIN
jgi:hypothetical protein